MQMADQAGDAKRRRSRRDDRRATAAPTAEADVGLRCCADAADAVVIRSRSDARRRLTPPQPEDARRRGSCQLRKQAVDAAAGAGRQLAGDADRGRPDATCRRLLARGAGRAVVGRRSRGRTVRRRRSVAARVGARRWGRRTSNCAPLAERVHADRPGDVSATELFTKQALAKSRAASGRRRRRGAADLAVIAARWLEHDRRRTRACCSSARCATCAPQGRWTEYVIEVGDGDAARRSSRADWTA